MTTLLRRILCLEAVLERRDHPGPGLAAVLRYAETHQPDERWWAELGQIVAESLYQDALRDQQPTGLAGLLAEARRWEEDHR